MNRVDAADFEHSDMFNPDSEVGYGGWGDPENDLQITTGAFADIIRPYPSPHHIRRNFTLEPFASVMSPFPDNQTFIDPKTMANVSFTKSNIDFMIGAFPGDFLNFHAYMEGAQVRSEKCLFSCFDLMFPRALMEAFTKLYLRKLLKFASASTPLMLALLPVT